VRYALLIHELPGAYDGVDDSQRVAITAEYVALRGDERVQSGERLRPASTATTLRAGGMLTDGPFADTKEHLIGFYVIDVPDLDTALEWAAKVPNVRTGSVEVRPVMPDAEAARADVTASAATG
jgi:hypothetical protein